MYRSYVNILLRETDLATTVTYTPYTGTVQLVRAIFLSLCNMIAMSTVSALG